MPMLRLIDPQGSGQEGSIPPTVSFGITPISVDDARVVITSVDVLISHVSPSILVHFESIFGRDVATSLFVPLEGSGDLRVLRGPLQSTLVRRWRGRNIALRRSQTRIESGSSSGWIRFAGGRTFRGEYGRGSSVVGHSIHDGSKRVVVESLRCISARISWLSQIPTTSQSRSMQRQLNVVDSDLLTVRCS